MPIPSGSSSAGLQPGSHGSSAYFASIREAQDRAAAAAVLDPINPRARHRLFFNPDPDTEDQIFRAFDDPNASLVTIAVEHNTTVEGLSAWMARPDIAQRLHHLKTAAADFISLTSTTRLIHARNALTVILCEYTDAACHKAGLEEGRGSHPGEHTRRDRETARKACHLLMRLANFNQTLRPPRHTENLRTPNSLSPLPRSSGGGREQDARGSGGSATAEGAVGAVRTDASPAPDDLSDADLLTQIQQLLAHIGATSPATAAPPNQGDTAPTPEHAAATSTPSPMPTPPVSSAVSVPCPDADAPSEPAIDIVPLPPPSSTTPTTKSRSAPTASAYTNTSSHSSDERGPPSHHARAP